MKVDRFYPHSPTQSSAAINTYYSAIYFSFTCLVLILLAGCSEYQVTLNDRDLYTPPKLIAGIAVADTALESCIQQTIIDQRIVKPEQLTRLICTHGGISSLTGIEQLTYLEELILSNNQLISISALGQLPKLSLLNLKENPNLACDQIDSLEKTLSKLATIRPAQCE